MGPRTTGHAGNTDAATDWTRDCEKAAVKATLDARAADRTVGRRHAIVVIEPPASQGEAPEVTKIVTRCNRDERDVWMADFFGLSTEVRENTDVAWGIAFVDARGEVQMIGNDLTARQQARALLESEQHQLTQYDIMTTIEAVAPRKDRETQLFAYCGDQDDLRSSFDFCHPEERAGVLELRGLRLREVPSGYAWVAPDDVVMAFGDTTELAQRAATLALAAV